MNLSLYHILTTFNFCLYDTSESVTISAFILAGHSLTAKMFFDGPLSIAKESPDDFTGKEMLNSAHDFYADLKKNPKNKKIVQFKYELDMDHMNPHGDAYDDDDDDDWVDDKETTAEERRQKRAEMRKKALEKRQARETKREEQRAHLLREGEPYVKTLKAKGAGWYYYCVEADVNPVHVEIDMRKESDYNGLNANGHVKTTQELTIEKEKDFMMGGSAKEEGLTTEEFNKIRDKLQTLRSKLSEIQSKQAQEKHRLTLHASTNQRSHSRMRSSSMVQTIAFVAVTAIQVYTIQRWFKGHQLLGR